MSSKLAVLLTLPLLAAAQVTSSHRGWSFSDTLQTATAIVVADITGGTSVDTGSLVSVAATARVVRVLKGTLAPDATLNLAFSYKPAPFEGPEMTSKVPAIRALLFLERSEQGYQPMQAASRLLSMGGYLVPVSREALVHSPDSSLNTRLSREYAQALQEMAATYQADLAATAPAPLNGYRLPTSTLHRNQFEAVAGSLLELPADSLPVLQSLSESSLLPLRVVGLAGRLQRGDATALAEIEKDLPRLAGTREGARLGSPLSSLALADKPAEAHTLARIALADPSLSGAETALASALGRMHRLEFLPYAMTLLDSPDSFVRDASMMSACEILRDAQPSLWKAAAMQPHCPDHAPLNDTPREQADIQFWKQWWTAQHDGIAKLVALPDPRPPARWSNASPEEVSESGSQPMPLETIIQSLLQEEFSRPSHAHNESGAIVEATHSPSTADSLLSDPADRQVFRDTAKESQRKYEEYVARRNALRNVARVGGAYPTREQIMAAFTEWESSTKTIVASLRTRLTADGWKALERYATSQPQ